VHFTAGTTVGYQLVPPTWRLVHFTAGTTAGYRGILWELGVTLALPQWFISIPECRWLIAEASLEELGATTWEQLVHFTAGTTVGYQLVPPTWRLVHSIAGTTVGYRGNSSSVRRSFLSKLAATFGRRKSIRRDSTRSSSVRRSFLLNLAAVFWQRKSIRRVSTRSGSSSRFCFFFSRHVVTGSLLSNWQRRVLGEGQWPRGLAPE
jgi:hypothetical protein